MTLNANVGHIVKQAGTGQQAQTGIGFQGKGQIILPSHETAFGWLADGDDTGCRVGAGFAASATSRGYASMASEDAQTAANLGRGLHTNRLLAVPRISTGASPSWVTDFVSFDSDGYTWDWITQNETGAYLLPVLTFGGDDITVVKMVQWQTRSTIGTITSPSIGGAPKLVFNTWNGRNTEVAPGGLGARGAWGFGAFNAAGEQFAMWGYSTENANPTQTSRSLLDDHCFHLEATGGHLNHGSCQSNTMGADTFTVYQDDPVDAADLVLVNSLALCGTFQSKIITFAKDASDVDNATDTINVGFPWKICILASCATTSVNGMDEAHHRASIGFSDGTNHRVKAWTEQDNVSPTSVREYLNNDAALVIVDNDTITIDAACVPSVSGNNAILTWTTNSAVATRVSAVFLGDAPSETPVRSRPTMVV